HLKRKRPSPPSDQDKGKNAAVDRKYSPTAFFLACLVKITLPFLHIHVYNIVDKLPLGGGPEEIYL
ncbi:MAG: hypothetical protein J6Q14_00720, partial [Oscillospiraceae bacterium]|nr:hypothetical protein [Oscillospiraceae bacterium]